LTLLSITGLLAVAVVAFAFGFATIGLRYGLINQLAFTMPVLVAIITTATTGPAMRRFAT
jgi:hypothetical protein